MEKGHELGTRYYVSYGVTADTGFYLGCRFITLPAEEGPLSERHIREVGDKICEEEGDLARIISATPLPGGEEGVAGRFQDLQKAVLAYDKAIESCANSPAKMASFCSAQGDTLDALYEGMLRAAGKDSEVCKRVGCVRPLAYPGAEYCGAACSAQRREPKR